MKRGRIRTEQAAAGVLFIIAAFAPFGLA